MINIVKKALNAFTDTPYLETAIVIKNANTILGFISDDYMPTLSAIQAYIKNQGLPADADERGLKLFKDIGFKTNSINTGIELLQGFIERALIPGTKILNNYLEKHEFISKDHMSPRDAAIVDLVNSHMRTLTLINKILTALTYIANDDEFYRKKYSKELERSSLILAPYIKRLSKEGMTSIIHDINKLSDEIVTDATATITDKKYTSLVSEFSGNPVFEFLKWWEEIKFERYEAMKVSAELTRLKLTELRNNNGNAPDTKISKAIKYYETKLKKLEVSIKEYEEDV